MIVVFVALVPTSVLVKTGAKGETCMNRLTDNLHVSLRSYLYSERFSDILFVFNVSELAFPGWLGGCCLNRIPCRIQVIDSSLPKIHRFVRFMSISIKHRRRSLPCSSFPIAKSS